MDVSGAEEEKRISVLVTGAAGFCGQHMVEYLLNCTDPKYEVIGTDLKKPTDPHYPSIRFIEADLTKAKELEDNEEFKAVLKKVKVIFHIAGLFHYSAPLQKLMQVNVIGTQNLFNAILKAQAELQAELQNAILNGQAELQAELQVKLQVKPRVVVWSAAGIFGTFEHLASLPATEDMEPKTDTPYLVSKWLQEREALNYWKDNGIPVTVIRPSAVYGPRSTYGMALSILLVGQGKMQPFTVGSGKNHSALVHVEDVVGAAEFLSRQEKAIGEVYHVTDDGKYTLEKVTRYMAMRFRIPFIRWIKIPPFLLRKIVGWANEKAKACGVETPFGKELIDLMVTNTWLSNEKLKNLGYKFKFPDSLDGLNQVVSWYEKEGWL